MRGEIICIGDELMSGRVADTNSRYALSRLWPLGIEIGAVVLVGDDQLAIKDTLCRALGRADFVLVSGGLGTTDDDITARMAAEVFELPLAESQRMVKNLRAFLAERGREPSADVLRMAQLPEGAEVLCPTCAGFRLTGPDGQPVFFLPGVPGEMHKLTDERVVPELVKLLAEGGQAVVTREVRLFGLPESEVGARLKGLADRDSRPGVRLGYYPVFPEVQVTVTVKRASAAEAETIADQLSKEIQSRLAGFVVSTNGELLEERVGRLLGQRGLTLALAESCTGGLIGHRITSMAGSSDYFERGMVVYSNLAKEELLGVRHETLENHGAVSAETAREMALGACKRAHTDIGLSVTGIAGPSGGTDDKPVGTVFFGLAHGEKVESHHRRFIGNRAQVKAQSAETALDLLRRYLEEHAPVHSA
jgi:nicotinamide-nucleotide amidase